MIKYYRLIMKNQLEECIIVNNYDLKGFDHRKLWKGEKIEEWNNDIALYHDKEGLVLDYIPNVLSWLIFSNKTIEVLKELKINNIQVFPVSLQKKDSMAQRLHYNVVNVITSIAALNWEKSNYLTWEDDPRSIKVIRQLVMNKSAIKEGVDIFTLEEAASYVVVSDNVKVSFEKSGITGVDFWPLEIS